MNKLHDLFLLTVAFVVVICISVSMRTNLGANTASTQPNITIGLPSDLPGDLREDGWHFYIYEGSRGVLCYKNQCLIASQINDYYVTPWGNCYWHDTTGWHFKAAKGPMGDKLEIDNLKGDSFYGEMPTVYAMDISRTYEMGVWKHYIKHLVPPGDRYLHVGYLYYNGREVKDASNYNDYMKTPWGNLYWVGKTRVTRYGPQGWMRTPNARFPIGQELFPDEEDGYDFTKQLRGETAEAKEGND